MPYLHHPWVPKDKARLHPSNLYKPLLMSWDFEHHYHLCLEIPLLPVLCFVFLLTLRHPKKVDDESSYDPDCLAWVPHVLCSPCLLLSLQCSQQAAVQRTFLWCSLQEECTLQACPGRWQNAPSKMHSSPLETRDLVTRTT